MVAYYRMGNGVFEIFRFRPFWGSRTPIVPLFLTCRLMSGNIAHTEYSQKNTREKENDIVDTSKKLINEFE